MFVLCLISLMLFGRKDITKVDEIEKKINIVETQLNLG